MLNKNAIFIFKKGSIYHNLAIEEFFFRKGPPFAVLFYSNPPCIVLGRNQNPWKEGNLSLCLKNKIHLARRHSGGGTVYHDLGNLNISLLTPRNAYQPKDNIQAIIEALKSASDNNDINNDSSSSSSSSSNDQINTTTSSRESNNSSSHNPNISSHGSDPDHRNNATNPGLPSLLSGFHTNDRNDILYQGKKLSGSAYRLAGDKAYHHFTLLVSSNLDYLVQAITPSPQLHISECRGTDSVRSKVTKLHDVGRSQAELAQWSVADWIHYISRFMIESDFMKSSLIRAGFQPLTFNDVHTIDAPQFVMDNMTVRKEYEILLSRSWIFGETPKFSIQFDHIFDWGPVVFKWKLKKGGLIEDVDIKLSPHIDPQQHVAQYLRNVVVSGDSRHRILERSYLVQVFQAGTKAYPMLRDHFIELMEWKGKLIFDHEDFGVH